MKQILGSGLLFFSLVCSAGTKDSTINYLLPDSVKAISFLADITVNDYVKKKYCTAGIKTDAVSLALRNYFGKTQISFSSNIYPNSRMQGLNVHRDRKYGNLEFDYSWRLNETYKLLISQATDSAENFSLYSGYVFLPKEDKWKYIGTIKIEGRSATIRKPAFYFVNGKKQNISVSTGQVWCQRQNGSWKNMLQTNFPPPVVNLYSHVDSLEQMNKERSSVEMGDLLNKTDVGKFYEGIYYTIIKEGSGKQVNIHDTVVAYYKGYLFKDGSVFDETKDKPATFPLNRLIKGWQIGVPLCKVGGKIKLIIPSNLGYSIRTRAAKIPPNSILVFEIEVVDAKSPQ